MKRKSSEWIRFAARHEKRGLKFESLESRVLLTYLAPEDLAEIPVDQFEDILESLPIAFFEGLDDSNWIFDFLDEDGIYLITDPTSPQTHPTGGLAEPTYDFAFPNFEVNEANSSHVSNEVKVIRTEHTENFSTVNVVLTSQSATAGQDFKQESINVDFNVGETTKFVPIEILGDTDVESDEAIALSFDLVAGGIIGTTNPTSTLTIKDDDSTSAPYSYYEFTQSSFETAEENAAHVTNKVRVTRTGSTENTSSVDVVLYGDSAKGGEDFSAESVTIVFNAGETTKSVPIEILGDTLVESDELINLSFANFSENGIANANNSTSTLTITNDDSATIEIDDVEVIEGHRGVTFTVTLSNAVDTPIVLQANSSDGSARSNRNDFDRFSSPITIAAGTTSQTLTAQVRGDLVGESDESFSLELSSLDARGRDVTLDDPVGVATIVDIPLLFVHDASRLEGDDATTNVLVTAELTKALSADMEVQFSVVPDSANEFDDYVATNGVFTIPAGQTTHKFPVAIVGDESIENDETFTVRIDSFWTSDRVAVHDARSKVTIINDDSLFISEVKVSSTEWTDAFKEYVDPSPANFGYPIPLGAEQLDPLPWAHINQIQLKLSGDISSSFNPWFFGLGGYHIQDYRDHIVSIEYDSDEFTVTITLDTFLGDDQLMLAVNDQLWHATGVRLDGEWTTNQNNKKSGDGIEGGEFEFRFDVLPGDVDQSGTLRFEDGTNALLRQFNDIGSSRYLALADIDGSGTIRADDGVFSIQREITEKPKGIPKSPNLFPMTEVLFFGGIEIIIESYGPIFVNAPSFFFSPGRFCGANENYVDVQDSFFTNDEYFFEIDEHFLESDEYYFDVHDPFLSNDEYLFDIDEHFLDSDEYYFDVHDPFFSNDEYFLDVDEHFFENDEYHFDVHDPFFSNDEYFLDVDNYFLDSDEYYADFQEPFFPSDEYFFGNDDLLFESDEDYLAFLEAPTMDCKQVDEDPE